MRAAALLLLALPALAQEPVEPAPEAAPDAVTVPTEAAATSAEPAAEQEPAEPSPAPLEPWEEPYVFVVTSEPMGNADDRSATRVERLLREQEESLTTCRIASLKRGEAPMRFMQLVAKMSSIKGTIRKAKVVSGTGSEQHDQCVIDKLQALALDPPPMFPDHLELYLTWSVPPKPEDDDSAKP